MADDQRTSPTPDVDSLFFLAGKSTFRSLEKLQLARENRLRTGRIALVLTILAWCPLLLLAAVEGVAWGHRVQVPLLADFLPYGQLIIAIPVLVLGEITAGRRLALAAKEFQESGVLAPGSVSIFDGFLNRAISLGRGKPVDLVILMLTLGTTVVSIVEARDWLTGGWQVAGDGMTMAGWWYLVVSLSVLRFLELRWLWRALLWAWVLWRVAGLELVPKTMHPDRAGGLAFLGMTQASFGVLVFAFGIQLSCLAADAIVYRGADLTMYRGQIIAYLVASLVVLLAPLFVFSPKLTRAREEQLVILSGHGFRSAGNLGRRLRSATWESDFPADEISGLADFGALYENARLMRPVPIDMRDVVMLVLAAVVPFVPLIFLVVPAGDVVRALASLLV